MVYYAYGSEPLMNEAIQKRGHVQVGYCSVVGTHDDTIRYFNKDNWRGNPYLNVWRIYETVNGMPVTGDLDFNVDPTFGISLRDRELIHTALVSDRVIKDGRGLVPGAVQVIPENIQLRHQVVPRRLRVGNQVTRTEVVLAETLVYVLYAGFGIVLQLT